MVRKVVQQHEKVNGLVEDGLCSPERAGAVANLLRKNTHHLQDFERLRTDARLAPNSPSRAPVIWNRARRAIVMMSRLIRAINLAVTRGSCCSLLAMAVLGIGVLMPDKCIAVCRERIVQGLTSDRQAAYLDKYAEVKEFTFNRCSAS